MSNVEYCARCNHAEFAHNGEAHRDSPKGCDLCMCKDFVKK